MMNDKICQSMVAQIDRHSVWIRVVEPDSVMPYAGCNDGRINTVPMRCMTLRAVRTLGKYQSGQEWKVPYHDLGSVIRSMAAKDVEFFFRVQRAGLTKYDVERIFLEATHGLIHLYLYDYGPLARR